MSKVTPFIMFNDQLEAAIALYTATFPDSEVRNVARTGKDGPITSAEFVVGGQAFKGYNGGPYFTFSEGFSLFVDCEDQAEVDEYWDKLVAAGATPSQCGWIKGSESDRYICFIGRGVGAIVCRLSTWCDNLQTAYRSVCVLCYRRVCDNSVWRISSAQRPSQPASQATTPMERWTPENITISTVLL